MMVDYYEGLARMEHETFGKEAILTPTNMTAKLTENQESKLGRKLTIKEKRDISDITNKMKNTEGV